MTDLRGQGLVTAAAAHTNLGAAELVELAIRRGEGKLADSGALTVSTGEHTGRSPKDRYIVAEPSVKDQIHWGAANLPLDPAVFARLADKVPRLSADPRALRLRRPFLCRPGLSLAGPRHRRKSLAFAVRAACSSARTRMAPPAQLQA